MAIEIEMSVEGLRVSGKAVKPRKARRARRITKRRAYAVLDALIDHEGEICDALMEQGHSGNAISDLADAMRHLIDEREAGR